MPAENQPAASADGDGVRRGVSLLSSLRYLSPAARSSLEASECGAYLLQQAHVYNTLEDAIEILLCPALAPPQDVPRREPPASPPRTQAGSPQRFSVGRSPQARGEKRPSLTPLTEPPAPQPLQPLPAVSVVPLTPAQQR